MRKRTLSRASWLYVIPIIAACGDSSRPSSNDLSVAGNPDLAGVSGDLAQSVADLSHGPYDLNGVDVSCNATAALTGNVDPIGSWSYIDGCASDDAFKEIKDNCTATFSGLAVTGPASAPRPDGNLTLNASGTYTRTVHSQVTGMASISGACAAGGCAALQGAITTYASGATATCTGAGTCTCSITTTVNRTDAGTWTRSGSTITATAAGGSQNQLYTFSVDGAVFRYRGDNANPFGDHGVTYVLVK